MDECKVWQCQVIIGRWMTMTDMVFIDGIPHLVLQWEFREGTNEWPAETIRLDPRNLSKLGPPFAADYLYGPSLPAPPGFEPPSSTVVDFPGAKRSPPDENTP